MPVAGYDSRARADAHFRWAERYHRESDDRKAAAHFGRAMEYERRSETQTTRDKHQRNKDTVYRNRAASGRLLFGAEPVTINWIQPPAELVRAGRMSVLDVRISQLDTPGQLTVKATCIYMNSREETELEAVIEMRVVQLDSLDYIGLLVLMHPGFTEFSNAGNNPHYSLVQRQIETNTERAFRDLKTKSKGPVAIVTNITTTMRASTGADAQAEGLGLRVLHALLSDKEFKLVTKLRDDSFVVMSTDPADAAGKPLPMTLSETGQALDRSVRLDQLRCYGFEADVTDGRKYGGADSYSYMTSIVRAKLRSLGASGMPLPSGFLSVIRMAQTGARIPALGVRSGGLIRKEDGSCFVNAVITLPYDLEIPLVEIPFRFSDGATAAVKPTLPGSILYFLVTWFYEQDSEKRKRRKLLDGSDADALDREVLYPLQLLLRYYE